jgi:hypothetical protein
MKLTNAPLPKFDSDQAAAEYFDRHSVAGVWDQLPAAKPAKLSAALAKKIRDRHIPAKSSISTRLKKRPPNTSPRSQ